MSTPPLLTEIEVLEQVRDLVERNKIAWTRHVQEKMAERGYSKDQVKACLKSGQYTERPTNPNLPGPLQYSFRMEAKVDGEGIAVAASLIPEKRVIAITVFDPTA